MKKAILIAGLKWGDEGKGAAVDYLCRQLNKPTETLVVRYNGGPQAGHNVIAPDGRHHTFSQFSSGTLIDGVRTHLSKHMLINPYNFIREEQALQNIGVKDAYARLTIDPGAVVITPFDRAVNRAKEAARGADAHGSCGMGVGEARQYHLEYGDEALFVGDLGDKQTTKLKLRLRQLRANDALAAIGGMSNDLSIEEIAEDYYKWDDNFANVNDRTMLRVPRTIVFEGAQGVLLDERDEFIPHNTWTKTTFENAEVLLREAGLEIPTRRIGCVRSYSTRHGLGPFRDDKTLDFLPEPHNEDTGFQGKFRRGHFNLPAARQALDIIGGVDEIHMSHVDHLKLIYPGMEDGYENTYINNLERLLETPVTVLGYGPMASDRIRRQTNVNPRRRSTEIGAGVSCGA